MRQPHIATLQSLSAHDLRRFPAHLNRRKLSSHLARAFRAFLNYCVGDELLAASPFEKVQMPRLQKKILRALSPEEIHAYLSSCMSERNKALCLFLLDSGVRASELVALNVGDIDLKTGVVAVRKGKGQGTTYVGARTRKQARRYFAARENLKPDEPAFASERGGTRLRVDGLVQLMGRL